MCKTYQEDKLTTPMLSIKIEDDKIDDINIETQSWQTLEHASTFFIIIFMFTIYIMCLIAYESLWEYKQHLFKETWVPF